MKDFYTFIVGSTINATIGIIDNEKRFQETIETLNSIRRKVPNAKILFVDNSVIPLSKKQKQQLESLCDICEYIDHNIFTLFANGVGSKGMGEAYILYHALMRLENSDLVGKRIFKLSGRYKLADGFDISEYDEKYTGKYCFKINDWDVSLYGFDNDRTRVTYYETRLFSFCHTLFYEYADIIKTCFQTMIEQYGKPMCNWEMCHQIFVPIEKVVGMDIMYVEGINAENGVYRFE